MIEVHKPALQAWLGGGRSADKKGSRSCLFCGLPVVDRRTTVLLAPFLHCPQLGCSLGKTSGGGTVVELGTLLVEGLFRGLLRFFCSCFVDVTGTDSRVGKHLDRKSVV